MKSSDYYGAPLEPRRELQEKPQGPEPIIGAQAIANLLRIDRKRVYRMVEGDPRRPHVKSGIPVRRLPGFGLVADKHMLEAWWKAFLAGDIATGD